MKPPARLQGRSVLAAKLLAPLVIVVLFHSTLVGTEQLAFRDVGHFYTPLYDYVAQRCALDALPLWNPLDQTGIPLLGETTTAVLYPLRYLVFALPIAPGTAMAWYVVLHLCIASLTAATAARWYGVSRSCSTLAGVVYPLSGSVLFLYTNPPFLVAASWLPLVLGASLTRRKLSSSTRLLVISLALTMMVLGGDPQTALHAVLISTVFLASQCVFKSRNTHRDPARALAAFVAACFFAALLSLPQLAASVSWSAQSYRALNDEPQTLWSPPTTGSQQYNAFSYSVPPWHLADLYVPRVFGDLFPINHRWSVLIPGDGRMWTPSLYAGIFAFVALLSILRRRRWDRWHTVAVVAAFCSFGEFGGVWLASQFTSRLDNVDSSVGGAYWFLYHFLPGYDTFRYPAKWLPLLSLSLAITAAKFLDHSRRANFAIPNWSLKLLALGLVIAIVAGLTIRSEWHPDTMPSDRFWGPLQFSSDLVPAGFACLVLVAIALLQRSSIHSQRKRACIAIIVVITAIDLALNARHLIATVDQDRVAQLSHDDAPHPRAERWLRVATDGGFPQSWRSTSSASRVMEVEATQRSTWFGRWHLVQHQPVFNNMTSIHSNASTRFWQAHRSWSKRHSRHEKTKLWRELRRWLAIDGIVQTNKQHVNVDSFDLGRAEFIVDDEPPKLFTLHTNWNQRPASAATKQQMLDLLDARLLDTQLHDTTSTVVTLYSDSVLTEAEADAHEHQSAGERAPFALAASVGVASNAADSASVDVSTAQRVLLARAVLQDGHWNAVLRSRDGDVEQPLAVYNVDHLTQGVVVPPGDWTVTFRYRPAWLTATLIVAAIAWTLWLALLCRVLLHRSRISPSPTATVSSPARRGH